MDSYNSGFIDQETNKTDTQLNAGASSAAEENYNGNEKLNNL